MENLYGNAVASITSWRPTHAKGDGQPNASPLAYRRGSKDPTDSIEPEDQSNISPHSPAVPKPTSPQAGSLEVGLRDISQHTSQQNAPKRISFHKPPSSNGDLNSGFQFSRPVLPRMDMTRQRPANAHKHEDAKPPTNGTQFDALETTADRTETAHALNTTALTVAASTSGIPSTRSLLAPVLETAENSTSRSIEAATTHVRASPPIKTSEVVVVRSSSPASEAARLEPPPLHPEDTSTRDTVIEHLPSNLVKLTEPFVPEEPNHAVTTPKQQNLNRPMRPKPLIPRQPQGPRRTRVRVTKSRQRSLPRPAIEARTNLDELVSKSSVTQEDLLHVLLERYNREKQEREQARASHATEIHELETLSRSLWERLQESQQKARSHETELSSLRAQQPKVATQIKKLRDYVKGLTNDQHRLRDSFTELQQIYRARQESKQELDKTLQSARQAASDVDKRTSNALKDARHEIENLMRTNRDQKAQLERDDELLQYERTRNQRFEVEVARINTTQQQSMHTFAEHANHVVQKINSVLSQTQETPSSQQPESLDEIKAALRQCLGSLDDLRQEKNIKVEDFSLLEGSMRLLADGIKETIHSYHEDVKSSGVDHHHTFLELKEELKTLNSSIATDRTSAKQVADFEAKKAEVELNLLAADKALEQERQKLATAGERESALTRQISSLEFEAATLRSRTQESSAIADRLREIASQNKTLRERLDALKDATSASSNELQHKFQEHASMQLHKEDLESQLREERAKATLFASERLELERSATMKLESLKVDQSLKAKWETQLLVAEHRLSTQKLEGELAAANSKTDKLTRSNHDWGITFMEQVRLTAEMRTAKELAEKCAKERLSSVEALAKEQNDAHQLASNRLTELQEAKAAWNMEITRTQQLQKMFDQVKTQLEEKDTELKKTQKSLRLAIEDMNDRDETIVERDETIVKRDETIAERDKTIVQRDAQIRGQDLSISERVSDVQQANADLEAAKQQHEAAKQQHEMDIRHLNECHQATEASDKAEIFSLREKLEALRATRVQHVAPANNTAQDDNVTSPKPRRRAERSAVQEMQQVVKDSQSQLTLSMVNMHIPSPSPEMLDDGMQYIDPKELDIPPTPDASSQIVKTRVSFAGDQTKSGYFGSQQESPSKSRPSGSAGRVVEDSQDLSTSTSPRKRPSFATPTYSSIRGQVSQASSSQSFSQQSQSQSIAPRSILKSSNASKKRSTTAAGLASGGAEVKKNRRTSTSGPGLGPVLPDSQSPHGSTYRARRVSRAAPLQGPKDDKYIRRFSQELQ